jgi:hypothetical protein
LDDPRQAVDATRVAALRRRRDDRTARIGEERDLDQTAPEPSVIAPVALH